MEIIKIHDVEIQLNRKKIKNMYISVHPPDGRVKISVPLYITYIQIIDFIESKILWIKDKQDKVSKKRSALDFGVWEKEEIKKGQEYLKRYIPEYIAKWEVIIGVKIDRWNVRLMKTRWGSCNIRDKKICINLALAKKSPELLEYIIVHEMVHLLEKGHNKVFYGYMDQFLPNWRTLKNKLEKS